MFSSKEALVTLLTLHTARFLGLGRTMTRLHRAVVVLVLFIAFPAAAVAGGGWINKPGALYAKVGVTTINTNMFHANDGSTVLTADFQDLTVQVYAEYGILERLSAQVDLPLIRRHAYVTAQPVSGIGDLGLGLKYGILTRDFPVALAVSLELPTGDRNAFGRNKSDPASIVYLPTGDGELNVWTRLYASHSFYPAPVFLTIDAGYNSRTKGLTDQYQAGLQGGSKFFDRLWLFGNLRRLATAGRAKPEIIFSSIGVGEGVEYTSYGLGASLEVIPHVSATFDLASAFGKVKNIYGGVNLGFGIAVDF